MVVPAFGCSRDGIQPPESILFCRRGLAPILPLRRDDPAGMAAFFDVLPPGVLDRRSGAWAGIQPAVWGDLFCSSSTLSLVFIPGWPTGSRAEVPWRDVSLSHRCSKREGMTLPSPGPNWRGCLAPARRLREPPQVVAPRQHQGLFAAPGLPRPRSMATACWTGGGWRAQHRELLSSPAQTAL